MYAVMKRVFLIICLCLLLPYPLISEDKNAVYVINIDGAINPIVAKYIEKSISRASESGAQCLIIQLDTPGGLDTSMRNIVKAMENSSVPVIVYVSPSGARAASAGVIVTLASHIAAMAPGTNIGAAHPVNIGGQQVDKDMRAKIENDAVAYIKGLALKHGRNADWAEKAVRKSVSITAEEALSLKVINYIAPDLTNLLQKIDGKEVKVKDQKIRLATKNAPLKNIDMSMKENFLNTLSDPNFAYILLMIGMWGIFFELSNPGAIFPGVIGGISLILAFVAFQTLPINYAGAFLILLGIIFFIAEIKVTSYGLLAVAGTICLGLGSIMLFESPEPFLRVSWKVILPAVIATGGFFTFALTMAIRAQMVQPTTGAQGLIGEIGVARSKLSPGVEGKIFLHGEFWNAISDDPVEEGEKVKVVAVDRLKVRVKKLENP